MAKVHLSPSGSISWHSCIMTDGLPDTTETLLVLYAVRFGVVLLAMWVWFTALTGDHSPIVQY